MNSLNEINETHQNFQLLMHTTIFPFPPPNQHLASSIAILSTPLNIFSVRNMVLADDTPDKNAYHHDTDFSITLSLILYKLSIYQ